MEIIARLRFKLYGNSVYPDATFTPRVSFGVVKGYTEPDGKKVPPFTVMGDIYKKATGKPPYKLPKTWLEAKDKINPKTPFDFVSTNDIIGGNSGSPVIDTQGHAVGLIFDGNIYSLGNKFVYKEVRERAVSVDTAAILEALKNIYHANRLVKELLQGYIKY